MSYKKQTKKPPVRLTDVNPTELCKALHALDIEVRYNDSRQCIEIFKEGQWVLMNKTAIQLLRGTMREECVVGPNRNFFRPNDTDWGIALTGAAHKNKVNPPKDYIESFSERATALSVQDAKEILESLAEDALGIDMSSPLHRWGAAAMWVGVVERSLEPGCSQRVIPVLIGRQNCGKSSFVKAMLPDSLEEYFQPSVSMFSDDQAFVYSIKGMMLGECPELHGASRADARNFKARMGGQGSDTTPLKNAHAERYKRTIFIIGTANHEDPYPRDITGQTRMVPMTCEPTEDNEPAFKLVGERRDQCWAAALCLHRHGFKAAFLPNELEAEQAEKNEEYTPSNDDYLVQAAKLVERGWHGRKSLKEVAQEAGVLNEGQDFRNNALSCEFKNALKAVGLKEKRPVVAGVKLRVWESPTEPTSLTSVPAIPIQSRRKS